MAEQNRGEERTENEDGQTPQGRDPLTGLPEGLPKPDGKYVRTGQETTHGRIMEQDRLKDTNPSPMNLLGGESQPDKARGRVE